MTHKVNANWKENLQFSISQPGGNLNADGKDGEDNGLRPKPLMLSALLACTGMDVTSLLKKMRVDIDDFTLEVEAELTNDHPKYYKKVHVIYTFSGKELNTKKINKSVDLSVNRYCGVYEMFRQFAEVSHEIIFIDNV